MPNLLSLFNQRFIIKFDLEVLMNCIKMELRNRLLLLCLCIIIFYIRQGCCTIACNIQPEKPIIGEKISFNCNTVGNVSEGTKLIVRSKQKSLPVTRASGKNNEESVTYSWIPSINDTVFDIKCKEKVNETIESVCTKTISVPVSSLQSIIETELKMSTVGLSHAVSNTQLNQEIAQQNKENTSETQLLRPTTPAPVTNTVGNGLTDKYELRNTDYFTTVTYEEDYDYVNTVDSDISLFEISPTVFWSLVLGLVTIFFVVIIATMCLVFLTQARRRKEREHVNVPYTGSMEILTGPFRRPTGTYLDLKDGQAAAATPNTVNRACQTLPCNPPWLAIDVDNNYEPNGEIIRPASVAGECNLEVEPNVLGPRGVSYVQTKYGLIRSDSDRRYSAVCRTRTQYDPHFYIPQQRNYRHSDHEMYHLQKHQSYDVQPIATEFEPVRRYKRRATQIAGARQSRPYSYVDPSISQLVPPSASGKAKTGNQDELSDSSM